MITAPPHHLQHFPNYVIDELNGHSVNEFNGNDGRVYTNGSDEECDEVDTPVFDSNVNEAINMSQMDGEIAAGIPDSLAQESCDVASAEGYLNLSSGSNIYPSEVQMNFAPDGSIEYVGEVFQNPAPYNPLEEDPDGVVDGYSVDGDADGYSLDGDADGCYDFYDEEYDSY